VVKTRIHDLAAEFGIPSEQLLTMLREMDIFVRSHLSALEPGQVSQVRVRWERDKRRNTEEPKPKRGRRKAKAVEVEAPAPAAPRKRRRTAAEVAEADAKAEAEEAKRLAVEEARLELERALEEPKTPEVPQTLEERAKALFKDLPPVEEEAAPEPETPAAVEEPATPPPAEEAPEAPAVPAPAAAPSSAPAKPFIPPRVARPAATQAPRPVFSSAGPGTKPGERERRKKGKKSRRSSVDQGAVKANISKTLRGMKSGKRTRGGRSQDPKYREIQAGLAAEEREKEKTRIRVNEFISASELAELMKVPASNIVMFAFKELGLMITVNQRLDFDQIELIASEFGFEAVREEEYVADVIEEAEEVDEHQEPRPPVVTIMGHVDHGKTSLLDYIRKANIVAGEAGGITQHIGAYHVELPEGQKITFLDTPGHEAFTAMRARGAQVTDLVVLIVAADDQVMPQTIEAISHAKNAGVPLIVAVNKVDLPSANAQKTMQDLLQHNVVLEEFGGDVLSAPISAKTGEGVDVLLEKILLQAELLDIRANADRRANGTVLEATLDPGKGPVATILVERGTLRQGDDFICGKFSGRVRAMFDERGNTVESAGPSIPVQVLGFDGVPAAGDAFVGVANAGDAREIAQKRQRLEREAQNRRGTRGGSLEDFSRALKEGEVSQLRIIIKADQGGPAEALADALAQLGTDEVQVDVVHRGVGAVSESDVLLAKASEASILGFHVRPDAKARAAAEREKVEIRTYTVIYEAVEEVRKALEGLLRPEEREVILGEAEVLQTFKVSKVGTIAGCNVTSGVMQRDASARLIRDGVAIYTGAMSNLKRFKDDVKEVREGLECGIAIENFNDVKVGDRIESFLVEQVQRTLEDSSATSAV
jgi:translation initiation factor IF-2